MRKNGKEDTYHIKHRDFRCISIKSYVIFYEISYAEVPASIHKEQCSLPLPQELINHTTKYIFSQWEKS